MEYIIKNAFLKAVIKSKGAELIKLIDKDGVNRLNVPSMEGWNKVSPVLFPLVSQIKGEKYIVDGKEYSMPKHGFFKEYEYEPFKQNKTSISFKLEDNSDTFAMYPYHFCFIVTYSLFLNSLKVTYKIYNKDSKKLLYMVGAHPGFKVPLFNMEDYQDYYLNFEKKETSKAMQVVDGFIANEFKLYLSNESKIELQHSLFNPDAIILTGLKSKYVDLLNNKNKKAIRFYFKDFEILAIWSKLNNDNAKFVCLEPWSGIQKNFVNEQSEMGINELDSNKTKKFTYKIKVIN